MRTNNRLCRKDFYNTITFYSNQQNKGMMIILFPLKFFREKNYLLTFY